MVAVVEMTWGMMKEKNGKWKEIKMETGLFCREERWGWIYWSVFIYIVG